MAFISKARLQELEVAEERLAYFDDEDRKARREGEIADLHKQIKTINQEREDEIEDLATNHDRAIRKLKRSHEAELEKANDTTAEYNRAKLQAEVELKRANARITELEAAEKNINQRARDLDKRELAVATREDVAEAREDALGDLQDVIERAEGDKAVAIEKAEKAEYQHGYADGLADGIRAGSDVNVHKGAQELLEKVVLITVAKDQPGDTYKEQIADTVRDNLGTLLTQKTAPAKAAKK